MKRHLSARWIAAWLAVFGLVFAPTLSRAMAGVSGGVDWVEVCSSQGSRLVPSGGRPAAQSAAEAEDAGRALLHQLTSHCPLCGVASGSHLAPPPEPFALRLEAAPAVLARAQSGAQRVDISPRTRPQPRAPPLSA